MRSYFVQFGRNPKSISPEYKVHEDSSRIKRPQERSPPPKIFLEAARGAIAPDPLLVHIC